VSAGDLPSLQTRACSGEATRERMGAPERIFAVEVLARGDRPEQVAVASIGVAGLQASRRHPHRGFRELQSHPGCKREADFNARSCEWIGSLHPHPDVFHAAVDFEVLCHSLEMNDYLEAFLWIEKRNTDFES